MNSHKLVTANFRLLQPLTVHKDGNGGGGVGSSPPGIDGGATCSASFAPATVVTLTATADISSTFAGWSGACTGSPAISVRPRSRAPPMHGNLHPRQRAVDRHKERRRSGQRQPESAERGLRRSLQRHYPDLRPRHAGHADRHAGCWLRLRRLAGRLRTGRHEPHRYRHYGTAHNVTASFARLVFPLAVRNFGNGAGRRPPAMAKSAAARPAISAICPGTVVTLTAQAMLAPLFRAGAGSAR